MRCRVGIRFRVRTSKGFQAHCYTSLSLSTYVTHPQLENSKYAKSGGNSVTYTACQNRDGFAVPSKSHNLGKRIHELWLDDWCDVMKHRRSARIQL